MSERRDETCPICARPETADLVLALQVQNDVYDATLTAARVALTKAGVPETEPYPVKPPVSDYEQSLRAGGRALTLVERIKMLADNGKSMRDCGQDGGVCVYSPGCVEHMLERNRELLAERDAARPEVARLRRDLAYALQTSEERLAHAHQLQTDIENEQAGRLVFRKKYGALDNETMGMFLTRLASERDAARVHLDIADAKLGAIDNALAKAGASEANGGQSLTLVERIGLLSEDAAEGRRLRKLFDDAGEGEHNVLALLDHYMDREHLAYNQAVKARDVVRAAKELCSYDWLGELHPCETSESVSEDYRALCDALAAYDTSMGGDT